MQSKLAVIIGGTSGVGKHTAIDLANQNYHVIIVGSRADKGRQAQADISQSSCPIGFGRSEYQNWCSTICSSACSHDGSHRYSTQ